MIDQIVQLQQQGLTRAQIAEQTGLSFNQVKYRLSATYNPQGIQDALQNTGLTGSKPMFGWRKTKNEDGTSDSVFWRADNPEDTPEDIIDRITSRINRIKPTVPTSTASRTCDDLVNFMPLFDVHLAMRIGDYGTHAAVERLTKGSIDLLNRAPPSAECIIVNGGDFTHQNDDSNATPRSKHPLPVDTDYLYTSDVATDVTVALIDRALQSHDRVTFKAVRGNHDENTPVILRAALRQRYRNEPRVSIQVDDLDFFAYRIGRNLLCAHHGDLRKQPKDLVLGFAARYPELWGDTVYRELHTGHKHHRHAIDLPGMLYEQHRAISPRDVYATKHLYDAPSEMQLITYKMEGGRYGTVTHAF